MLREINPAAEENIAATRAELAEDSEALESLAAGLLDQAGAARGATAVPASALEDAPAALRRLALRALAERAAGRAVALGPGAAAEIWRLASRPEGGELELGGGLSAVCEAGYVRFAVDEEAGAGAEPVGLAVPGRGPLRPLAGAGRAASRLARAAGAGGGDPRRRACSATGSRCAAWRQGDRMRPLGLEGSKSLQDLFTDAGVPRSLRRALPVVAAGGRIAWIAGVAVSEEFKLSEARPRWSC